MATSTTPTAGRCLLQLPTCLLGSCLSFRESHERAVLCTCRVLRYAGYQPHAQPRHMVIPTRYLQYMAHRSLLSELHRICLSTAKRISTESPPLPNVAHAATPTLSLAYQLVSRKVCEYLARPEWIGHPLMSRLHITVSRMFPTQLQDEPTVRIISCVTSITVEEIKARDRLDMYGLNVPLPRTLTGFHAGKRCGILQNMQLEQLTIQCPQLNSLTLRMSSGLLRVLAGNPGQLLTLHFVLDALVPPIVVECAAAFSKQLAQCTRMTLEFTSCHAAAAGVFWCCAPALRHVHLIFTNNKCCDHLECAVMMPQHVVNFDMPASWKETLVLEHFDVTTKLLERFLRIIHAHRHKLLYLTLLKCTIMCASVDDWDALTYFTNLVRLTIVDASVPHPTPHTETTTTLKATLRHVLKPTTALVVR